VANLVSDGDATHGSKAAMLKMTKAVEYIFPQAPNYALALYFTVQPISLDILIMWLSCRLSLLVWGVIFFILRAQRTSTSAVIALRSLSGK
jgi:hypothetical protein